MARVEIIGIGIILLTIAVAGYVTPVGSEGHTIPQLNDVCGTGLGQFGQLFSAEITENCREFSLLTLGIYGAGIIGIILIIVGAAVSGGRKESEYISKVEETEEEDDSLEILKKRYARGEISKEEFEEMKNDLENS